MKLFGFNITRSAPPVSQPTQRSVSPEMLEWLHGNEYHPTLRLGNAYEQVVWVYRAINVLAEQVANIQFLFSAGERGRENLITSGPLVDFYNRPHPFINRFQYWELRIMWLMLRGECMRIPLYDDGTSAGTPATGRTPGAKLKSVLLLDPAKFQHIIENHLLVGWRYTGSPSSTPLESQVFLPEEVWFERLPNPYDFWRGLSPLEVASLAAKTDYTASNFMHGFLENNADNGLIVRTDEQLDDEQRAQIYAALRNRKRGSGCADKPHLLWSSAEVVQPTISSADLQFLENRKFSRAEICAAFGVPEEIVASTDYNKYDVMQGARLNFIENRVAPLCARLEAEENETTVPILLRPQYSSSVTASQIQNQNSKIDNVVGWFDLDSLPILQNARLSRLTAAKIGFDMGIPFNELNRILDLGFKPLPHGDTPYLPKTLQSIESIADDPTKPPRGYVEVGTLNHNHD
jgi:phage portal protein BeeE